MRSLRRLLPALMALTLAAVVPLSVLAAASDAPCAAVAASAEDSGCCSGGAAEASDCAAACPAGGAAAITERDHVQAALPSIPPVVRASKGPVAYARAPDTAPPKYSVS